VRPQAMIGHSIGEYVAACLAGVLFVRCIGAGSGARATDAAPARGDMLAVMLPEGGATFPRQATLWLRATGHLCAWFQAPSRR